jgi:probable rRNA maturation factor
VPPILHFNRLGQWPELRERESELRRAALSALTSAGDVGGEVSFTFVSRDEIRDLNRTYLDRDRETDVIAFELGDEGDLLGDVYIAPDVAAEFATAHGETHGREVARLVIHGALHVIGHDHPEGPERDRSPMFHLQEELLRSLTSG